MRGGQPLGGTSISLCRCKTEDILCDPVVTCSAEFWTVWSMAINEGEELENQTGAT